ncbi:hypothetical protein [Glutamicibacter sp. FBE19]|uniref:DUF7455 domain-containing protein n=1 Tax=Glutamicibacter sp. FBE19 TaxID=2761534 RepID=UPI0018968D9E|nr:hypothetical protein [Glutamicibacter sp. FBE19]MBF6671561.1 hypothetical protein [Glutamicibacter sp. FBE19]
MKPSDLAVKPIRDTHVELDVDIEFAIPETLTLLDRCDQCGAQALHVFAYRILGGVSLLMFCNHHARNLWNAGARPTHHRDYRMNHTDWEAQATAQAAKAKADAKGTIDPAPPTPIHLSMWDLDRWA